jgi:hypothetical protein
MTIRRIALGLLALVATVTAASAMPNKPDCSAALADVRAAVAAVCDCAAAVNHGQYVRCAGRVVKEMVGAGTLVRSCKGAMVRVFAKSACGKPEHVTCCFATRPCRVKKAAACERLGGTPGTTAFCADACMAGSPSGAFVD